MNAFTQTVIQNNQVDNLNICMRIKQGESPVSIMRQGNDVVVLAKRWEKLKDFTWRGDINGDFIQADSLDQIGFLIKKIEQMGRTCFSVGYNPENREYFLYGSKYTNLHSLPIVGIYVAPTQWESYDEEILIDTVNEEFWKYSCFVSNEIYSIYKISLDEWEPKHYEQVIGIKNAQSAVSKASLLVNRIQ